MKIIFIGGASGSGKSTLAQMLLTRMQIEGLSVLHLSMDDYFVEVPEHVTDIEHFRRTENFDQIEKYDLGLLTQHLELLNAGQMVTKPIFDFPTNRRLTWEEIGPADFVVLEGLFALTYAKTIPDHLEKTTVFVSKSSYLDLIRTRSARDSTERNLSREDVLFKERATVGPAFFFQICKDKKNVDFDISNDTCLTGEQHPLASAVSDIMQAIHGSSKSLSI
jgi:uridine kinase